MNLYLEKINEIARGFDRPITLMEVCGGHTNTVMKYGLRDLLPSNVKLISGPGCPVCVTAQSDIDAMLALAEAGVPVASYGDMMNVPGTRGSLDKAKQNGADVAMLFSATDMLKPENKHRVFFGIGFETTTPMTAYLLEEGITVYSAHKVMPPPMKLLIETTEVDGFIDPGHVSCITGARIWDDLPVPQVISGFKKDQIIRAVYKLLELIRDGRTDTINDYQEVVSQEGNLKAQALIAKHLKPYSADWRGLGKIPESGVEPRDPKLNARLKYAHLITGLKSVSNPACRCGDILQGKCQPQDCALFGKVCTPKNPIGACMVSETEGACGIAYKYLD